MEILVNQDGGDRRSNGSDEADRQINLAKEQDPNLRHSQEYENRRLDEEVRDVARSQEDVVTNIKIKNEGCETEQDGAFDETHSSRRARARRATIHPNKGPTPVFVPFDYLIDADDAE
jgi:hypothetical protein